MTAVEVGELGGIFAYIVLILTMWLSFMWLNGEAFGFGDLILPCNGSYSRGGEESLSFLNQLGVCEGSVSRGMDIWL